MLAGVDPGFGYAPGASRRGEALALAGEKAEGALPALAVPFIAAMVRQQLPAWLEAPEGNFPVMRINDRAAAALPLLNEQKDGE